MTFFCCDCQAVIEASGVSFHATMERHSEAVHGGDDIRLVGTNWIYKRWSAIERHYWNEWYEHEQG